MVLLCLQLTLEVCSSYLFERIVPYFMLLFLLILNLLLDFRYIQIAHSCFLPCFCEISDLILLLGPAFSEILLGNIYFVPFLLFQHTFVNEPTIFIASSCSSVIRKKMPLIDHILKVLPNLVQINITVTFYHLFDFILLLQHVLPIYHQLILLVIHVLSSVCHLLTPNYSNLVQLRMLQSLPGMLSSSPRA